MTDSPPSPAYKIKFVESDDTELSEEEATGLRISIGGSGRGGCTSIFPVQWGSLAFEQLYIL